jgi:hypothetical protein
MQMPGGGGREAELHRFTGFPREARLPVGGDARQSV